MDVIDRVPGLGAQRGDGAPAHGRRAHASRRVHAPVRRGHARGARLELARVERARADARARRQRGLEQPEATSARARRRGRGRARRRRLGRHQRGGRSARAARGAAAESTRSVTASCTAGAGSATAVRVDAAVEPRCSRRSRPSRRCISRVRWPASGSSRGWRPALPQVACFDTAFHATMPAAAATYALPAQLDASAGSLRRFGFHGLSHAYAYAPRRRARRPRRRCRPAGRDLPPRSGCVAVRDAGRPFGRHDDGIHARSRDW